MKWLYVARGQRFSPIKMPVKLLGQTISSSNLLRKITLAFTKTIRFKLCSIKEKYLNTLTFAVGEKISFGFETAIFGSLEVF